MIRYLLITALVLCLIASINFVVDPGGVYLKTIMNYKYIDDYTDRLISAKTGIRHFKNERMVKMNLARKVSGYDCIILGSSRAQELSVIANPSSLKAMCPTAMNLAIDGADFEEFLTISRRILQETPLSQKLSGKTILIVIDPWLFRWMRWNSRYGRFMDKLVVITEALHMPDFIPHVKNLLDNLLNLSYLEESIKLIKKTGIHNLFQDLIRQNQLSGYRPVPAVDYDAGLEFDVTLPDGSRIYNSEFIKSHNTSKAYIANGADKLWDNDEEVISLFKELLGEYRQRGFRIVFVLTPYHNSIFREANKQNWRFLRIVEARVRDLSKETGIPVYGSYDPVNIGCGPDEFFDYNHAKRSCLAKIPFPAMSKEQQ